MTANHLLLYRLAELMLAEQQHQLPVDGLFDDDQIGEFVKSIQIDSPYQQMLLEGVLTETVKEEKLYVTYTVEGYFHYVLGEVIFNKAAGKEPEFLKDIIENNKLNGASEGVEQCLIRDVENDDLSRLMWLIDVGGASLDACSMPLAHAFLQVNGNPKTEDEVEKSSKEQIKRVMDELLADPTDNDISILEETTVYLEHSQKFTTVNNLFNLLNENDETKSKIINSSLFIKSLKSCEFEYGLNEINQIVNRLDNNIVESSYVNGILEFYEINSKYKEALLFLESLNIEIQNEPKLLFLRAQLKMNNNQLNECIEISGNRLNQNISNKEKASYLNLLSQAYLKLRDFSNAKKYAQQAVNKSLEYDGKYGIEYSTFQNNFGALFYHLEEYSNALNAFKEVEKIRNQILTKSDQKRANIYINLGECYRKLGEFDLALNYNYKAMELTRKNLSYHSMQVASIETNLGLIHENKSNFLSAVYHHYKSLLHKKKFLQSNDMSFAESYFEIASCLQRLCRFEEAVKYYTLGLNILKHPHFVTRIVECFTSEKKYTEAKCNLVKYINDFNNSSYRDSKYYNSLIETYSYLVNSSFISNDEIIDSIIKDLNDR